MSTAPLNVVLISLDSTRADYLSCYGYSSPTGEATSPRIDGLALHGVRFDQAVSTSSWTLPAHHALFSGLPDLLHGATGNAIGVSPDRIVLARRLRDAGYQTAGFFSGPYLHEMFGFAEGFDQYEDASGLTTSNPRSPSSSVDPTNPTDPGGVDLEVASHRVISARQVSNCALRFLESRDCERPFFLFLHYFDVHYDYIPADDSYARRFRSIDLQTSLPGDALIRDFISNPAVHAGMPANDLQYIKCSYAGEIHWVDEQVGRLLDELDRSGLSSNTVVILVADHGDEFFEHGEKGHRKNLYDSTLRIPLILRAPGFLPAGKVIQKRASIVDVAPTILDLVGRYPRPAPPTGTLHDGMWGRSLLPVIAGKESPAPAVGFFRDRQKTREITRWSLWDSSLKVIVNQWWEATPDGVSTLRSEEVEVFDLVTDPLECSNLHHQGRSDVEDLLCLFDRVHQSLVEAQPGFRAGPCPRTSAEVSQLLPSLGYVEADLRDSDVNQAPRTVSETLPPVPRPGSGRKKPR